MVIILALMTLLPYAFAQVNFCHFAKIMKFIQNDTLILIVIVAASLILQELVQIKWVYVLISSLGVVAIIALWTTFDFLIGRRFARRFPWLYHLKGEKGLRNILDVEKNALASTYIYVVTPDLYNDANVEATINLVTNNLKRGVKYCFVTRASAESETNSRIILRNFRKFSDQVKIYFVEDMFAKVPLLSNILIVERSGNTNSPQAFLELPFEQDGHRMFWVKTDHITAKSWFELLLKLLQENKPSTTGALRAE